MSTIGDHLPTCVSHFIEGMTLIHSSCDVLEDEYLVPHIIIAVTMGPIVVQVQ